MNRDSYIISVERSPDGWWAIRGVNMPEGYGLYSQARRLDQVGDVARDAISALLDIPPDSFTLAWNMRHANGVGEVVSTASRARARAESAQREANEATKAAVDVLVGGGYTYRDIGTILGITHQRVQQISSAPLGRTSSTDHASDTATHELRVPDRIG